MWFTETPWPPVLICATLAVVLFAAWQAQQRTAYLAGVVGLVLAGLGIIVVERLIVTDRERIEESVHDMVRAFQRGDRETTLGYISDQAPVQRVIEEAFDRVTVEDDLRITDVQVRLEPGGERGYSHFRANATISVPSFGHRGKHATRWDLTWQREDGRWKVRDVQRLHPLTGEELGLWASQ